MFADIEAHEEKVALNFLRTGRERDAESILAGRVSKAFPEHTNPSSLLLPPYNAPEVAECCEGCFRNTHSYLQYFVFLLNPMLSTLSPFSLQQEESSFEPSN